MLSFSLHSFTLTSSACGIFSSHKNFLSGNNVLCNSFQDILQSYSFSTGTWTVHTSRQVVGYHTVKEALQDFVISLRINKTRKQFLIKKRRLYIVYKHLHLD